MTGGTLLMADGAVRTTFTWERIQSNADWVLPIGVCIAILLFVRWLYRRDAVELHPLLGWLLTLLRTAVFLGLLVLFLQPQWRREREIVQNSQTVLLVDTSLSMELHDTAAGPVLDAPAKTNAPRERPLGEKEPSSTPGTAVPGRSSEAKTPINASRLGQVAVMLEDSDFLEQLRRTHDVSVFQFNNDLLADCSVTLGKRNSAAGEDNSLSLRERVGVRAEDKKATISPHPSPLRAPRSGRGEGINWAKVLSPSGSETRIGQALQQLLTGQRGQKPAGIVLFSDGGQNAGISPDAAVALAQEMKIPIFTVGLGSDKQPVNVYVSDLAMPARAYPGDRYTLTGYLQAQRLGGQSVTVEVLSRPSGGPQSEAGTGTLLDSRQVILGGDGEVLPVVFELMPEETGRRTICFRVRPPPGDQSAADNFREDEIEIVARRNHVLLFAGGPTRDYQFLRSLLSRDHAIKLDVFLQTAQPGASQEGNLLSDFPATREEMFDYDCLVAFDPDWQKLSSEQVTLLESWVAEQGGGLIVIPGPIHTGGSIGGWTQNPALRAIRNLYPVEFPRRLSILESPSTAADDPYPLDFTREGQEADFLWLGDSASAARRAWADLPGVFSFTPVRGPKPGATVYARLSDPRIGAGPDGPVYFAGQFYGSGSVFYLGSGEMWRLRAVDETYFEQFYTKLIRHVSQGRLLRGSTRGVLLVGQNRYLLGNAVEVRAQLTDARLQPFRAPSVPLQVAGEDGAVQTVPLQSDPSRAGAYRGQFPALHTGTYRLELAVPESNNERLIRRVHVSMPELERERPQRNDALLGRIAQTTGGKYFVGIPAIFDSSMPLAAQLPDLTTTITQTDDADPKLEEPWLRTIMIVLCSLLCLEWLIRRLLKLA
ncbi:MAG: VWA domain-containing protein [Pirellulales bacterium]|nr:VWA domain-containing protein [Pirellulales bacterium]